MSDDLPEDVPGREARALLNKQATTVLESDVMPHVLAAMASFAHQGVDVVFDKDYDVTDYIGRWPQISVHLEKPATDLPDGYRIKSRQLFLQVHLGVVTALLGREFGSRPEIVLVTDSGGGTDVLIGMGFAQMADDLYSSLAKFSK